jgi:hypothetical protein
VTPNGPVYDTYACDFGSTDGLTINQDALVRSFGAGMANTIVQCAAGFSCDCF